MTFSKKLARLERERAENGLPPMGAFDKWRLYQMYKLEHPWRNPARVIQTAVMLLGILTALAWVMVCGCGMFH